MLRNPDVDRMLSTIRGRTPHEQEKIMNKAAVGGLSPDEE